MNKIEINIKLRPIRYAFLTKPRAAQKIEQIFKTNTCIWGGQFNPIIPYFKQLPKWWTRNKTKLDKPKKILNGYLLCRNFYCVNNQILKKLYLKSSYKINFLNDIFYYSLKILNF